MPQSLLKSLYFLFPTRLASGIKISRRYAYGDIYEEVTETSKKSSKETLKHFKGIGSLRMIKKGIKVLKSVLEEVEEDESEEEEGKEERKRGRAKKRGRSESLDVVKDVIEEKKRVKVKGKREAKGKKKAKSVNKKTDDRIKMREQKLAEKQRLKELFEINPNPKAEKITKSLLLTDSSTSKSLNYPLKSISKVTNNYEVIYLIHQSSPSAKKKLISLLKDKKKLLKIPLNPLISQNSL